MGDGIRLALSWLTVLPVPTRTVDARAAGQAIALAPLVGGLLGALGIGVLAGATLLGIDPTVAGLLTVGALTLSTRAMHLDGLADTADGLGCYGDRQRALAVMRDGGAGPFAVVALILVLGIQAACYAALATAGSWWIVPVALATGRAAFGWCCRRGVPAARPDGLGAMVAGSQAPGLVVGWWAVLALAATAACGWFGLAGAVAALGMTVLLSAHTTRRFGGVTGDVLGAASEAATTIVLVAAVAAG
ncbi:adenosylcobinamide-GDP ribazoletransferase [Actinoalloteichus hymeniacidonis]|uniref:Adenosylcobinamide-GDP ribazoletransferase n=1 Tax=Actinoalloteichus hymeniacidonis TaxID=340345 RepID=A0AAC9HTP8_9PSEU|nr:adenosylcobinamide-GDP ribazoletransferase [Actinoalloteichus hymeniacidonis]AOS65154.1 cobalamin-5'-phosphate synthase [Actinoalloteichus hymeniacidonis]MBB5906767.1 adenosylcobinamide-GDP ribazoletransferase [Actinoalloteichus hymeniacidonis]